MANRITEDCINCGACEPECPNQAITQGDSVYLIDAVKCDECVKEGGDPKCKSCCPVDDCIVQVAA